MMSPVAYQRVGTITVGVVGVPSGVGDISPVLCNAPFKDLMIMVRPADGGNSPYRVQIYFDGELEEEHTYPDADRVICRMMFPTLFPANAGTNAIPKYYHPNRQDFPGDSIVVRITNIMDVPVTFEVYAVYLSYEHCNFLKIT